MSDRHELVRRAFAALDRGDLGPLRELLDPEAKWVAVPQTDNVADTPICEGRGAIVDRLERHRNNGRRFQLGKLIEAGDRVAAEVTLLAPEWSGAVTLFRVFTFAPDSDAVVRLNDCIDESYALQVLVA